MHDVIQDRGNRLGPEQPLWARGIRAAFAEIKAAGADADHAEELLDELLDVEGSRDNWYTAGYQTKPRLSQKPRTQVLLVVESISNQGTSRLGFTISYDTSLLDPDSIPVSERNAIMDSLQEITPEDLAETLMNITGASVSS